MICELILIGVLWVNPCTVDQVKYIERNSGGCYITNRGHSDFTTNFPYRKDKTSRAECSRAVKRINELKREQK